MTIAQINGSEEQVSCGSVSEKLEHSFPVLYEVPLNLMAYSYLYYNFHQTFSFYSPLLFW